MGFFSSLFGRSKRPSADEWALNQLAQLGDNLSKPHKLEFQLRFPTKAAGEQAAPGIKAAGYDLEMMQDGEEGCSLVATKTMVPGPDELQSVHLELDALAKSAGGRYEGWGMVAEDSHA